MEYTRRKVLIAQNNIASKGLYSVLCKGKLGTNYAACMNGLDEQGRPAILATRTPMMDMNAVSIPQKGS